MYLIKEVRSTPHAHFCAIGTNTYEKSLAHLEMLFEAALRDFPLLRREDVTIRQYDGDHHRRLTFSIEFTIEGTVPTSYRRVKLLERSIA
jgi:hypothetical protein